MAKMGKPIMDRKLIEKYNVAVPRYTSYPTVPHWKPETFEVETYLRKLVDGFPAANARGLSLYVHLPFCERLCTYCGCNTRITINHKVEGPYIESVLGEWVMYRNLFSHTPKIKEIHLGGGTPTFFSPENLDRLVSGLLRGTEVSAEVSFSFEAHPANTTAEHLRVLRAHGFDRLSLGVQDFNPVVQKAINRFQTPGDVGRVTVQARELGYRSVNYDLVYGLPFQTLASVLEAVEEVIRLNPDRIAFYSYAHVPWKHKGQRAYDERHLPDAELKLELFMRGRERLLEAGYEAIGFDHFARPSDSLFKAYESGSMHRNFMGYTDLHTAYTIALGVSSIGDIGAGFCQNVKTVEGYRARIEKGEWPIFKGHLLDEQEGYIRKHILNLTCKGQTSWEDGSREERRYMSDRLPQLREPVADGLVEVSGESVRLTEPGKFFVRNVCSVFDRDYEPSVGKKMFAMGI